jgi:hypothetical protein
MKICDDHEDFKEETNAYIAEGLHVPHGEIKGMPKGNKETPPLIEIDLLSTPQDEPKITLVEKDPRLRCMLKFQDIIGIGDDIFKFSCWTNSMSNSSNSMLCSNDDHVNRLEFLENDDEVMFMFKPINLTPEEPLPNDELSAMQETYASFNYTSTCCYNLHVVFIMDVYV